MRNDPELRRQITLRAFALLWALPLIYSLGCGLDLNVPEGADIAGGKKRLMVQLKTNNDYDRIDFTVAIDMATGVIGGGYNEQTLPDCQRDFSETEGPIAPAPSFDSYPLIKPSTYGSKCLFPNVKDASGQNIHHYTVTVTAHGKNDNPDQPLWVPDGVITHKIDLHPDDGHDDVFLCFVEGDLNVSVCDPLAEPERNLEVPPITLEPDQPQIGENSVFELDVYLRNHGSMREKTDLKFAVSSPSEDCPPSDPNAQQSFDVVQDVEVPAGESSDPITFSYTWDNQTSTLGDHKICVWFDALEGSFSDSDDPNDNQQEFLITVLDRNIVLGPPTLPQAALPPPQLSHPVPYSVSVLVKNEGEVDEAPIEVTFEVAPPAGGAPPQLVGVTPSLEPQEEHTLTFDWTAAPAGLHTLTASINEPVPSSSATFFVEEHDLRVGNVSVSATSGNVGDVINIDVPIDSASQLDPQAPGGEDVEVTVTVRNAAGDPIEEWTEELSNIPPGGSDTASVQWDTACLPEGDYSVTVSIPDDDGTDTNPPPQTITVVAQRAITVDIVSNPGAVSGNRVFYYTVTVGTGNAQGEALVDVQPLPADPHPRQGNFQFVPSDDEPGPPVLDMAPPFQDGMACGEQQTLFFSWGPSSVEPSPGTQDHVLSLTVTASDPSDPTVPVISHTDSVIVRKQ